MDEQKKNSMTAEADGVIEGRNAVIEALRAAGCGEGDTVSIYDFEFDFID